MTGTFDAREAFNDALMDYLDAVAEVLPAGDRTTIMSAVAAAPSCHCVHLMSVRSYRCGGCHRFGILSDVNLNFETVEAECQKCAGQKLALVAEGIA